MTDEEFNLQMKNLEKFKEKFIVILNIFIFLRRNNEFYISYRIH